MSGVRAHTDAAASDASASIGAEAYAFGDHVAFGGAPSLHTAAHEAAHVVQQREGVQLKGGVGEAGDPYEQHADQVADAVVAGRSGEPILDEMAERGGGGGAGTAVQKIDRHHATGPAGQGPNTVAGGGATQTDAQYQTYAQISAGKVSDFLQYADKQADWSMKIADAAQRADLRMLMTWLRAADHRQTALDGFVVSDVLTAKADLPALDAYARARGVGTVLIGIASTITDVRAVGLDVRKLESAVQPVVLHQIFPEGSFEELRTAGKLDDFVRYVKTCSPMLQANNGVEVTSFLTLARVADPSSFKDVKDVRSYHRFQADALTALRGAQTGNPTNKPFTLILHSALDHNGAFHQDPELTATITAASNHTIMIEGAESLDAISARLPAIVALHGRDEPDPKDPAKKVKRIDQVMFAGHGSAHSIELAGKLATDKTGKAQTEDGELQIADDDLNLNVNRKDPASVKKAARTKQFMKQVMSFMSQDPATPHGRIVFNACLTASNEIDPGKIDAKASPDDQAKAMRAEIQKVPSLVTAMRQIAVDEGRKVDVRGGNGSFGRVGLVDGTGALDIVADGTAPAGPALARTDDPELTNPDKLVYVEKGTDPQGCMSAVAETWAKDRKKAIEAVQHRRAAPKGGDWEETVIQAMYELVETRYAANGAGIVLLSSVTDGFKELASSSAARVWPIWRVHDNADWALLEARLGAHAEWTGQPFVPLVFYHGWMFQNAAQTPKFLGALAAMTVRTSKDFLYMASLYTKWSTLVPAISPNPPDGGRLRLALRDVVDAPTALQVHTKTFLASLVNAGAFAVDVNAPLDGLGTDDSVLRTLGLHPSQAAGAGKSKANPMTPPPDANVDMNDDSKNESAVEAMSATGRVTATELYVRDQPSLRGKNHTKRLHKDDEVHVMGQTGKWYLLDHDDTRGYAAKQYIELQ